MMDANKRNGWKSGGFLILAVMILIFAATALAQSGGSRFGRGMGKGYGEGPFGFEHRLEALAEKLELTEEQVTAIEGIQEAGREKGVELRKEMMRLRHELEGEMLKDEPSLDAAQALVEKIGALRTEIQVQRLANRLEVRKQLTPEQRDKMLMMRGSFQGGRGKHGGRGVGPHGARHCDGKGPHGPGDCDGTGRGGRQRGARSW
jgi:Spy/CpxP family protein refolding chaperone